MRLRKYGNAEWRQYNIKDPDLSSKYEVFVGVDGCKAGWIVVELNTRTNWKVRVFPEISSLWNQNRDAKLILIDVPIGMRDDNPDERRCDKEARALLTTKRKPSVFVTPCRAAIYATTNQEVKIINRNNTGRSVSPWTFGIIPKIRELDTFLINNISARSKIREIHPEICFWALNGGKPMMFNKKTRDGFKERMRVLHRVYKQTDVILESARNDFHREATDDDILDSLAAAITGFLGDNRLMTLPDKPEIDAIGLPMEMVYFLIP